MIPDVRSDWLIKLLKIVTVAQNIKTRADVCDDGRVDKQGSTSEQAV